MLLLIQLAKTIRIYRKKYILALKEPYLIVAVCERA